MTEEIRLLVNKLLSLDLKTYINNENELIIIPKTNLYFRLDDVNTELDFKCKLLEWCSRDCTKGISEYWQIKSRKMINYMLGTNFTNKQFEMIYCKLGNRVNHSLTEDFIKSNYNFELLTTSDCHNCICQCLN